GRTLATGGSDDLTRLWNVPTGKPIPLVPSRMWPGMPFIMARPVSIAGAAVVLHDPRDGRVLVTLFPVNSETARSASPPLLAQSLILALLPAYFSDAAPAWAPRMLVSLLMLITEHWKPASPAS